MGVRVRIDELVLTGFGGLDADLLVESFRRELTRLLRDAPVALVDREVVAGLPALPRTSSARALGVALARSVHTGLRGGAP
ncbi:hypothetical protein [Saccharothrix coeruleofusca]|uniref:Uncharacterized protein n=1 Tax=Saccharothrix coeruleofusca TaxID=33919 RepID=A0A918AN64_9PSEU|nr:hypothetical protein [Saccharothrix coeruleofusca]MBP2336535.1 hypothetical protein [Saccharothrix coeruleofusca]GGP52344.1 hypothetical protein GCM10010185_25540 [Saccharothrix coeruleofusca]